ncbi:TMV resistance protein N-like protein, partial [Tanacetum coccineum]
MSSSNTNHTNKHDVFLSFNGKDTRHSFTDHLYHALIDAGIKTYRKHDDSDSQTETAINSSKASIVVLSENYASSRWCLDELVMIMERRRGFFHLVIPVYYHVDVLGFGGQEVKGEDKVGRWKEALKEVAQMNGKAVSG